MDVRWVLGVGNPIFGSSFSKPLKIIKIIKIIKRALINVPG